MIYPRGRGKWAAAAVAVAALVLAMAVQAKVDTIRTELVSENIMPTQQLPSAAVSAALGGFRGIAVDILWIQADKMINEKQYYQLDTYYNLISILQPNFDTVWTFNMWNLSTNISAEWGRPEEKWVWIKKGIDFGDRGLEYNPDSVTLWGEVGALYYIKVAKDAYFSSRFREYKGIEPNLAAAKHFAKALDLVQARGENDVSLGRLYAGALYRHALAVFRETGNVPETVRLLAAAEEQADRFLMEFPSDPALYKLLNEIRTTREKLTR